MFNSNSLISLFTQVQSCILWDKTSVSSPKSGSEQKYWQMQWSVVCQTLFWAIIFNEKVLLLKTHTNNSIPIYRHHNSLEPWTVWFEFCYELGGVGCVMRFFCLFYKTVKHNSGSLTSISCLPWRYSLYFAKQYHSNTSNRLFPSLRGLEKLIIRSNFF